ITESAGPNAGPSFKVKTVKPASELSLDDLAVGQMTGKDLGADKPCAPEDADCAKLKEKLGKLAGKKMSELTLDDLRAQGKSGIECGAGETICGFLVPHLEKKYKGKNIKDVMEMMKAGMLADIPYALF